MTTSPLSFWRSIEISLRRIYDAASQNDRSTANHQRVPRPDPVPLAMITALRQHNYIAEPVFKLLRELRRLRNAVTHEEEEPHVGAALAYAESAQTAVRILDLTTERYGALHEAALEGASVNMNPLSCFYKRDTALGVQVAPGQDPSEPWLIRQT